VQYSPTLDVEFAKKRATKHDVLETFHPFIKTSKLFLNAGVTVEEAEQLIPAGKVDGIFIQ